MQIQVKKYTYFVVKVDYSEFIIPIPDQTNYALLRNSILRELEKLDITDISSVATKITSLIIKSK